MGKRATEYPHTISFRMTDQAWLGIQNAIEGSDLTPHEWCRQAALDRLDRNAGLSKSERLLFRNLIRAQYLITHGFQMLADNTLTGERWKQFRAEARQRASEIADAALASYIESGNKRS